MKFYVIEMTVCAALATALVHAKARAATNDVVPGDAAELWLVNPDGAVDGLLLHDGRALAFGTEVGATLSHAVWMGDSVRIVNEHGERFVLDTRSGTRVALPPAARGGGPVSLDATTRSPRLEPVHTCATITAFIPGDDGHRRGFVLATGEQVRFPHGVSSPALDALRTDHLVTVVGRGSRGDYGVGLVADRIEDSAGHVLLDQPGSSSSPSVSAPVAPRSSASLR